MRSASGHSLPTHLAPAPTFVRCWSNSDQTFAAQRTPRCANKRHALRGLITLHPRGLSHLFQWDDRDDVDFDQHAGPGKLADGQQRMSRHRRHSERVLPALTEIGLIPDVSHISDHLRYIAKCGPVLFKRTLDLIESVFALRREVALVENVSALAVFILREPSISRRVRLVLKRTPPDKRGVAPGHQGLGPNRSHGRPQEVRRPDTDLT
jgi:hypothetical protein